MRSYYLLLPVALAAGAAFLPQISQANVVSPNRSIAPSTASSSPVEQVGYGRCRFWREECADRWGYDTHRYYRCLRRHGCGGWGGGYGW